MTLLILGLLVFLGTHSVRIVADGWRASKILHVGEQRYKGVYSLMSIAGLVLLVWGYALASKSPIVLYAPPAWTRSLAGLLTIATFILLAAAYVPGTRIKRAVGHPMVLGVKIWALAHLIANGTLADVLLFGAFLAWAIVLYIASRRRDRAAGTVYVTGPVARDVTALIAGLVAWAAFAFWLHGWLIGVPPFG